MRKLIFSIPGFTLIWQLIGIAYILARAIFAVVGVVLFGAYLRGGMEDSQIAASYVLFCLWGLLIVWAYIYMTRYKRASQNVNVNPKFQIKQTGDVIYNPLDLIKELEKKGELSESEADYYLSKYPPNKFKGKDWNKYRGKVLTLRESAQDFVIDGNTVKWEYYEKSRKI